MVMYRMSRTSSTPTPTATTSPSCSTKTRSNPAPRSSPSPKPPLAKTHGEWSLLLFLDCCDALPLRTLPRSRFAQSALTTKLPRSVTPRRLHAHVVQYGVDFIGGDFNMSAFSTVRDVFSDLEFAAPGNALLWGTGGVDDLHGLPHHAQASTHMEGSCTRLL